MGDISESAIRTELRAIMDPGRGVDIVTSGMVHHIGIADGAVTVILGAPVARGRALEQVRRQVETHLAALPDMGEVRVILTGETTAPAPATVPLPDVPETEPLSRIDRVLAIASGKGGVGKSTVTANLAVALALEGKRIGLLDADIFGPSQPRMMQVTGRPRPRRQDIVEPLDNYGVKLISMGLLAAEDTPIAWRGPMAHSALAQMLDKVAWGHLDLLLVDLPPGTGDIPISLTQEVELAGAVMVCTPQEVALLDARKAFAMLRGAGVPILGVIENMSLYRCPDCGRVEHIFGEGGARSEAERWGVEFLGELPLDRKMRECGDAGTPIVLAYPKSDHAEVFCTAARRLLARLDRDAGDAG